jgi:hypothetical protein
MGQVGWRDRSLRTQSFASDSEVAMLVSAFEKATIPPSEFAHAAHIPVALTYLGLFSSGASMRPNARKDPRFPRTTALAIFITKR